MSHKMRSSWPRILRRLIKSKEENVGSGGNHLKYGRYFLGLFWDIFFGFEINCRDIHNDTKKLDLRYTLRRQQSVIDVPEKS